MLLVQVLEFHSEAAHAWDSDVESESEILELMSKSKTSEWSSNVNTPEVLELVESIELVLELHTEVAHAWDSDVELHSVHSTPHFSTERLHT